MIKLVGLFRIKAGMSREDFIDHYETRHVPLILSLMPQICDYRRSYVLLDGAFVAGHVGGEPPRPPFDVFTEVWFPDRDAYDAMRVVTADAEIGRRIAEDEARFLDRDHMVMFLVDERCSSIPVGTVNT